MRVEPFNLRDFEAGASAAVIRKVAGIKPLLPGGRRREEAPPPPPSFNEEELKAAQAESYKKGFTDGVQEGRQLQLQEQGEIERKLALTVEHFAKTVNPMLADYRNIVMQMQQELPRVAMAIARKAAGSALTDNAKAMVEDLSLRCAEIMIGEPKLMVVVHASLAEALKAKLAALAAKLQSTTEITVVGDSAIPEADCRIEWKQGSFARDNRQLWQSIEQAVAGLVASARHEANGQLENVEAQVKTAALENPETNKE